MEKKYEFRSLTANKDLTINQVTLDALEFAIDENSEVTNVAITGNYGAGKSSIVESFEEKSKNKKFIHISLDADGGKIINPANTGTPKSKAKTATGNLDPMKPVRPKVTKGYRS